MQTPITTLPYYFDYASKLRDPYPFDKFSYNIEQDEARCEQKLAEAVNRRKDAAEALMNGRSRLALAASNVSTEYTLVAVAAGEFMRLSHSLVCAEGNFQKVSDKISEARNNMRTKDYSDYAAFLAAEREREAARLQREAARKQMLLDMKEPAQAAVDAVDPKWRVFIGRNLRDAGCPIDANINSRGDPLDEGCTFSVGELVGYATGGRARSCLGAVVVKEEGGNNYWIALSSTPGEEDPYCPEYFVPYGLRLVAGSELAKCEVGN